MAYNFSPLKASIADIESRLKQELQSIRTGRATPALLDTVLVEAYGSRAPLSHLSAVTPEDARTLRIAPWDASQVKAIEKAIVAANLGVSVVADERGLRVSFPELTSERRESLVKLAHGKREEARVSLRAERDKVWQDIQKKERSGELPEDDKFRAKEDMEKLVAKGNESFDALVLRKEAEIRG